LLTIETVHRIEAKRAKTTRQRKVKLANTFASKVFTHRGNGRDREGLVG
jgi:hypothetical protein